MTFSEQEAREERVRAFLAAVRGNLNSIEDLALASNFEGACEEFDAARRAMADLWNELWELHCDVVRKRQAALREERLRNPDKFKGPRFGGLDKANLTHGDEGGWRKEDGE